MPEINFMVAQTIRDVNIREMSISISKILDLDLHGDFFKTVLDKKACKCYYFSRYMCLKNALFAQYLCRI